MEEDTTDKVTPRVIGVVPARGGSKGVRRKNLQPINGIPLAIRACHTLREAGCDPVYITTDNHDIQAVAAAHGYPNIERPDDLAGDDATIDQVCDWLCETLHHDGIAILQPTVLAPPEAIRDMIETWDRTGNIVLGYPDRHLTWPSTITPPEWRDNRQANRPWPYREVGARIYTQPGPPATLHPWPDQIPDIDTPAELTAAQAGPSATVGIRVRATRQVGSGHVRRGIQIADALPRHDVRFFFTGDTEPWAKEMVERAGYQVEGKPDLWINDTLDTTAQEIAAMRTFAPVISLEDRVARGADVVVNALYPRGNHPNEHTGADWVILRPEFQGLDPLPVEEREGIVVSFGGTDPAELTERYGPIVGGRVILPPNRTVTEPVNMAVELRRALLVVCSAGTTLYEAARLGTPAVVIPQNPRELAHAHLGPQYGNLPLGLLPYEDAVLNAVDTAGEYWHTLSDAGRRLVDGRGLDRIVRLIDLVLADM
jgi:spore coat polysaccharide biosynthesis predicted glycosyltransferase SpsG